jgi:hypothetical protein
VNKEYALQPNHRSNIVLIGMPSAAVDVVSPVLPADL